MTNAHGIQIWEANKRVPSDKRKYGLHIKSETTVIMKTERHQVPHLNIKIRGQKLKVVEEISYLGSKVTWNVSIQEEISNRTDILKACL